VNRLAGICGGIVCDRGGAGLAYEGDFRSMILSVGQNKAAKNACREG